MASPEASEPLQWHYTDDKDFALHGHGTVVLLSVLCILLLVTLLYLYLRWTCYSNSFSTAATTETIVASTTERANHEPSGLDAGNINSIPVELHKEGENRECVICLGVFSVGEKMKILPSCGHGFHPDCIHILA
jgi:E3 ubiquitin-protein ligase ATL10/75/76/77/78